MTLENPDNPVERNRPPDDSGSETADHAQETQPTSPPITAPPGTEPCCKHKEVTCHIKRDRIDKITLWLEGFGLFVLVVYTIATVAIWCANKNAADAAKSAAETAHNALVISERPWVTVDVAVGGDFTFEKTGEAQFRGVLDMKNIGHSPAITIDDAYSVLVPARQDLFTEPVRKQTELCEPLRKKRVDAQNFFGVAILFPNQATGPLGFSTSVPKQWIDAGSFTFPGSTKKYINPVLVGCVDYRFSFAPEEHHQTGFIYVISGYRPNDPTHQFPLEVGIDSAASSLRMDRYPFGRGFYGD